ncbi:hypothetical protein DL93DRAFT_2098141 [Clavulina sp. PMI_390]|nr:hypothetical protein DL93DRAFT_2098141 [Clavulina sp. PMI_390]
MSAISAETTLLLKIPDGSSVVEWCAFPGNRWPCELWPQFEEINQVVNILLYFLTDSEYMLEVYQLVWTNGIPTFTRKAHRRHSRNIWITTSFHKAWLDGDYVCIRCQDGIVLWNWQQDTNGFIHAETSSAPLLFQLPFIGGYEDSPELYSIDLRNMGPDSSRYPWLEQKPVDIKVIRNLEGSWYMTAMAFGRRWTVPAAEYPALGRKDVLLCDSTQQTTGTKATLVSTWNHSARSLEYAPPIKSFTPRRYDSHLILPSGTILLDQGVSEISAREAVGIQLWGGKIDAMDSGKRTLQIPLPPSMSLSTLSPTAANLCPFSGTLLVRVHLGEPSNKEFMISCPRILALS